LFFQLWRRLSAEAKAQYEEMAKRDAIRYKHEVSSSSSFYSP